MKRKRDFDTIDVIKILKTEHKIEYEKKRKMFQPHTVNKKKFTEKDHYIRKLERCIINLYKKYKETEYMLEIERCKNIPKALCVY